MLNVRDLDEIRKLIAQDIEASPAMASARAMLGVLANHTFANLPATTTAITTGATTMGSASLTVKGPGNVGIDLRGTFNALNTLQPIVTPVITATVNGANTITTVGTSLTQGMAAPGNTSSPSTGQLAMYLDTKIIAQSAVNTGSGWNPQPGQTIQVTVALIGSTTGGSAPLDALDVTLQEKY